MRLSVKRQPVPEPIETRPCLIFAPVQSFLWWHVHKSGGVHEDCMLMSTYTHERHLFPNRSSFRLLCPRAAAQLLLCPGNSLPSFGSSLDAANPAHDIRNFEGDDRGSPIVQLPQCNIFTFDLIALINIVLYVKVANRSIHVTCCFSVSFESAGL
jgi:hypothetical protein